MPEEEDLRCNSPQRTVKMSCFAILKCSWIWTKTCNLFLDSWLILSTTFHGNLFRDFWGNYSVIKCRVGVQTLQESLYSISGWIWRPLTSFNLLKLKWSTVTCTVCLKGGGKKKKTVFPLKKKLHHNKTTPDLYALISVLKSKYRYFRYWR